ncbi:programmed cell death protein 5 [Nematocida sp. LUAm3]|nr:programmed cell death protein 5 [Nematocida sp. LUAm3]KAI5173855.1 programmed cell death protein 5 [Nematocida sp. LUAm2]KAI5177074.1 programmed cell death protein 5 [Nematocida sp. LUAm1]
MNLSENKQDAIERVCRILGAILTKNSLERLLNIKAVDPERYYKIEEALLHSFNNGAMSIPDEVFFKILQNTEHKKKTLVYSRRSALLDFDE